MYSYQELQGRLERWEGDGPTPSNESWCLSWGWALLSRKSRGWVSRAACLPRALSMDEILPKFSAHNLALRNVPYY